MKTFKDYLTESKRTFDFRVKIANHELTSEVMDKVEQALGAYSLSDITKPKSLPITKTREFPKLGACSREVFDVKTHYPAIPPQIQQSIHNVTGIPLAQIYVVNPLADNEPEEMPETEEGKSLLAEPELSPADPKAQDHVGLKRVDSLLKELGKNKGEQEQYKGVNDDILAKSQPKETPAKNTSDDKLGTTSPVGSRQNKIPSPVKGR
jgi:hypothetical protein